jgi:hypothetical protein
LINVDADLNRNLPGGPQLPTVGLDAAFNWIADTSDASCCQQVGWKQFVKSASEANWRIDQRKGPPFPNGNPNGWYDPNPGPLLRDQPGIDDLTGKGGNSFGKAIYNTSPDNKIKHWRSFAICMDAGENEGILLYWVDWLMAISQPYYDKWSWNPDYTVAVSYYAFGHPGVGRFEGPEPN